MRIAIVNDTLMAVEAVRRTLMRSGKHELAWIARNGAEAVEMCTQDRPDLVLMDLIMPVMDGVKATRQIMANTPCPILIVTASIEGNSGRAFDALGAGALDVVKTPIFDSPGTNIEDDPLLSKISSLGQLIGDIGSDSKGSSEPQADIRKPKCAECLIAIGASAGGPAALAEILSHLTSGFLPAIVVIQHVDEEFARGLADWLSAQSPLPIRVAREGDQPESGVVLLAGTSDHLVFVNSKTIGYTVVPQMHSYRPSVDAFFNSIVLHWRKPVVGVLLTGMGRDGAHGLKALRDAGCHTIAQDAETSAVYGMPKAAAALDAAVEILSLPKIAPRLKVVFASQKRI